MIHFANFISLFWLIFILYWMISAINVKKNIRTGQWQRSALIRIVFVLLIIILLQMSTFWRTFAYQLNPTMQMIGTIFCLLGLGFAVWARVHLGKNWSGTPSIKENHELITSGPYRFVRHPIYTGMLLALFGSALAGGIVWFVILIAFGINFLYRLPIEEKYMLQLFPEAYEKYRKKTKRLIPFIW